MKRIILCADDYGQNPAISQAIIELIEKKRLSATSCMTNAGHWSEGAAELRTVKNKVDIGVHFNFTDKSPLSLQFKKQYGNKMFPLSKLMLHSFLHQLDKSVIKAEIKAQLDSFTLAMNRLPDFIDGHQHVHHFPIIREALLEVYEEQLRSNGSYVRCVNDPAVFFGFKKDAYIKRVMIQFSGAKALKEQLISRNIPFNKSFSGIYDFANSAEYKNRFPDFLAESEDGGLIMCHPGLSLNSDSDSIRKARVDEFEYFSSAKFLQDCEIHNVEIARFPSSRGLST